MDFEKIVLASELGPFTISIKLFEKLRLLRTELEQVNIFENSIEGSGSYLWHLLINIINTLHCLVAK